MDRPSGPVRRFVTQVLALPVAVVVGVAALVVGGAGVASVVAVSDGTGPSQGPAAQHTSGPHRDSHGVGQDKKGNPGHDLSANPGLGHGCGHSAGKAKGHGQGLAHAPGQQQATCRAPGRLAGHGKPDKARPDKAHPDKAHPDKAHPEHS